MGMSSGSGALRRPPPVARVDGVSPVCSRARPPISLAGRSACAGAAGVTQAVVLGCGATTAHGSVTCCGVAFWASGPASSSRRVARARPTSQRRSGFFSMRP
ncbi:hypothetical protein ACFQY4_42745 [Catellatospora bangladeshensis]|uniref:hypothetical protein n=1 Tax=Catellatospora bangladeshensis TaxID=310355 RepID=UPI003607BBBE